MLPIINYPSGSQLLSLRLCILHNHLVHLEHKRHEVALSLKENLNISTLFAPIILGQDAVWMFPLIGLYIGVNNTNFKGSYPTGFPED